MAEKGKIPVGDVRIRSGLWSEWGHSPSPEPVLVEAPEDSPASNPGPRIVDPQEAGREDRHT
jgi:hypothetical protein